MLAHNIVMVDFWSQILYLHAVFAEDSGGNDYAERAAHLNETGKTFFMLLINCLFSFNSSDFYLVFHMGDFYDWRHMFLITRLFGQTHWRITTPRLKPWLEMIKLRPRELCNVFFHRYRTVSNENTRIHGKSMITRYTKIVPLHPFFASQTMPNILWHD